MGPKLPYFDEAKDSIDAYLYRFERYAELQKWNRETWGIQLSSLLRGKALEVYSRLPAETSLVYDSLSAALLKRFEITVEGLRKKVRDSKPERGETFEQFGERLKSYHCKWLDLGKVGHTFDELQVFFIAGPIPSNMRKGLVHLSKGAGNSKFWRYDQTSRLICREQGRCICGGVSGGHGVVMTQG